LNGHVPLHSVPESLAPGGRSIGFGESIRSAMQVTEEDGGKLNAFAREPRMVVMEKGEGGGRANRVLLLGGLVLVLVLVGLAARIS